VAWWTAQRCVNAAAVALPDVDRLHVTQLRIDEHRYRRVRWFRDPDQGGWRRVEPWMSVPGQRGIRSGVGCGRRPRQCHRRGLARPPVTGVARPDPDRGDRPAAFKKAIITDLRTARIAVDPFHLVQLANLCRTRVRQRLVGEDQKRRGRKIDPAWAHRTLLLRGYDTLSARARDRLEQVFATDDTTGELWAAWGVKEGLRLVLKTTTLAAPPSQDPPRRLGECRRHPRDRPALGHPEYLVAGRRGIHRHPDHERSHRT